ncbi:MAG: hypothetical protein BWZ10_01120 [candidate division BRC1 bacterium ADurb.BinA364]|nr:MAG: hypothetical protein BWZ10_01120 [candidate division BRC1 bacterium ADurb.BinA364]
MEYREIAADNDGKSLAHLLLGYSHENRYFKSGMAAEDIYAKAEDNYRAAADLAETGYLKRQALMGRARMLEIKGRIDDAIAIYEKIVADRKTAREEDIKRFGLDRESAKSKLDLDLPSIEEVFGAAHIAEVQIERLKALKESGALAAASERAVPAGAPLETAEIALASTDTATLETSEPLAPEAEAIAPELEAAPAPEPIEEPIQESAAPETAAEAAAEEPAMEPAPEAAAAPEPALETPATPAEEPAAEPAAETDPEPAMEPAAELAPEAEALAPETEAATAPEPIEEPILESAVPEAAPEAAADAPAPGESAPRTDEAATTQTAQAADPPRDSMPAAP